MSTAHDPRPLRGWHGRGYLPHFDAGDEQTQTVTFRLADSMPRVLLDQWRIELLNLPEATRDPELWGRIETYLNDGRGECHLQLPGIGALVEKALLHFDGIRYALHAWVVMPNHVHVVFTPTPGVSLSAIVGSWKSFTAKEANRLLGRSGRFWHEDYFDRYVRNEGHFADVVHYIEMNPVTAELCGRPEDWPLGSARLRDPRGTTYGAAGTAAVQGGRS